MGFDRHEKGPVYAIVGGVGVLLVAAVSAVEDEHFALPVLLWVQQIVALGAKLELGPSGHASSDRAADAVTLTLR